MGCVLLLICMGLGKLGRRDMLMLAQVAVWLLGWLVFISSASVV